MSMVTPISSQVSGARGKVTIFSRYGPCSSPASGKIHYGRPSLLFGYPVCETVFLRWCIGRTCQYAKEVTIIG